MATTTYVITIEDEANPNGIIKVYETDGGCYDNFSYKNFEITEEFKETDNEDFNDIARWLTKTILEIKKLENQDEFAHCDWSAENEYEFKVSITHK
ncbi:MAG: hypothetical protein MJ156_00330 [Alphaproteobacteria bacterium]|nr:hypothetical protein [Alphaproteobacteria bacterium]